MRELFGNLRHFLSARLWAWWLLTGFLGIVASTVLHDVNIADDVAWAPQAGGVSGGAGNTSAEFGP